MMWIFWLFILVMNLDVIVGLFFCTLTLKINNITDLYKGGKNNLFNITVYYYSFKNETITKYVNYSDYFNQDAIICAKSNSSLGFINNDNNDFIYNICVLDREGELIGFYPK